MLIVLLENDKRLNCHIQYISVQNNLLRLGKIFIKTW